jgi:transposase-like protein
MAQTRFSRYPEEFRRMAVERFRPCENIVQLAKELNVPTQTLYRWNEEAEREFGAEFATEKSRESRLRREVHHLKRLLADFFNGVLQKVEARRRETCASGGPTSTTTSGT